MKSITFAAVLASAIASALAALTINTPTNVVECEPTQFQWSGGTGPYYLNLVPARQTTAPAIKTFPTQDGTSYTWTVDLQSGTSFTIVLKDSTGATAYSDIVTIIAGASTSCINTNITETGSGGSSGSSASATSGSGSSASASGSSASSTSSASGSSSTTKASGAGRLGVSSAFVAGLMGLAGAALL